MHNSRLRKTFDTILPINLQRLEDEQEKGGRQGQLPRRQLPDPTQKQYVGNGRIEREEGVTKGGKEGGSNCEIASSCKRRGSTERKEGGRKGGESFLFFPLSN